MVEAGQAERALEKALLVPDLDIVRRHKATVQAIIGGNGTATANPAATGSIPHEQGGGYAPRERPTGTIGDVTLRPQQNASRDDGGDAGRQHGGQYE